MLKCLSKAKDKAKGFIGRNKVAFAVSVVSGVLSSIMVSASAVETGTAVATSAEISTSLVNGFQTAVNDLINYAVAIVPVAISAFGITWAIKKCVSFFKGVTGKGS